jgi:hypothetical protein
MLTHKPIERIHSRYIPDDRSKDCSFCLQRLSGEILRVGNDYYCDEFCAECRHEIVPQHVQ